MRARTFWFGIAAICLTLIIVTWLFGPGAADKAISVIGGAVLLGLLGVLYFIPALLSRQHSHRNVHTIFAVNLLLGWTLVGWVAALVWALAKPPEVTIATARGGGACHPFPHCAEAILPAAERTAPRPFSPWKHARRSGGLLRPNSRRRGAGASAMRLWFFLKAHNGAKGVRLYQGAPIGNLDGAMSAPSDFPQRRTMAQGGPRGLSGVPQNDQTQARLSGIRIVIFALGDHLLFPDFHTSGRNRPQAAFQIDFSPGRADDLASAGRGQDRRA